MGTRPLGRSLDPLPEESVIGYLLRLSFRLRISPLHLAKITGCVRPQDSAIGRRTLFDADTRQLARTARLAQAEADSLTATAWTDRYAPIRRSRIEPGTRLILDGWLASTSIRYCPQCLAGDGSPAQQEYGGPWKKAWHLPVTFACTSHQRFLRENCQEEHGSKPPVSLIPFPGLSGIHPLQCRLPPQNGPASRDGRSCGMRLDQDAGDELPRPAPGVLELQDRILGLLDPQNPAPDAARAFTDLRLLSALVCLTWPLSENLMDTALASAVSEYRRSSPSRRYQTCDRQPRGILATAGILTAAWSIRHTADLEGALARFITPGTWPTERKQHWALILLRHQAACSPALRKPALAITVHGITSSTRKRRRRSVWAARLATASETAP